MKVDYNTKWVTISGAACLLLGIYNLYLGTRFNLVAGGMALFVAGLSGGILMANRALRPIIDAIPDNDTLRMIQQSIEQHQTFNPTIPVPITETMAVHMAEHFQEKIKTMHANGEFPPGISFEFPMVTVKSE